MTDNTLPSYQAVQQDISSHDPVSTAAELHGLMCGLICATGSNTRLPEQYQESAIMRGLFPSVLNQFSHALDQETFMLELLLPDDNQSLGVRTQALAEWAQGFMAGLGEGGFKANKMNSDLEEILADFQDIAQIHGEEFIESEDVTEEDEKAFVEVY